MEETDFSTGPYSLLEYSVSRSDKRFYIEVKDGELGRIPVENQETVENLINLLEKLRQEMKEQVRQREEL